MDNSPFPQPISEQIWNLKYKFTGNQWNPYPDQTVEDTWFRIATACSGGNMERQQAYEYALEDFKFLPAGRIIAGAGTGRNVTLFNCFVMGTIPDSLPGIFDMLKEAALTMQQGGGIGYDFSTLRPKGTLVRGVDSDASGPLSFMDVWDTMCKTIMSAGNRRGAMMATMHCEHPDVLDFIEAKKDTLRLRNFNVSVLVTDEFMKAVKEDLMWNLVWNGKVYQTIPARDMWNRIIKNTYAHAEPGVIFIDRINNNNNLYFMEKIAATNPCGEQPLPPYGACLLGSINLVKFVMNPFIEGGAHIHTEMMEEVVRSAVRMLDAVIDTSKFPLVEQEDEAKYKRRMGLGVTGLADALFMLGYRYGSKDAVDYTRDLMRRITMWAYDESLQMAKEIGPCPALSTQEARDAFCKSYIMQKMPKKFREEVRSYGLRNTHLMSIAPTGTISLYAGNVSSGIEPIFAWKYDRKVTQPDGSKTTEEVLDYAVNVFELCEAQGVIPAPKLWWDNYMITTQDLTPEEHLKMQAAAQEWIDSSISKTINVPEDISFDDFRDVYQKAYDLGCKGCTTYRPNDVTGSVLSIKEQIKEAETPKEEPTTPVVLDRPNELDGTTYKLKWQGQGVYVNFTNYVDHGKVIPFEIFVNSKNPEHLAWVSALTRMVSAIFRRGGDVSFVVEELKSVFDPKGGQFIKGRYVPSLVALIGHTLEEHLNKIGYMDTIDSNPEPEPETVPDTGDVSAGVPDQCPSCHGYHMVKESGCLKCLDCGHSKCG